MLRGDLACGASGLSKSSAWPVKPQRTWARTVRKPMPKGKKSTRRHDAEFDCRAHTKSDLRHGMRIFHIQLQKGTESKSKVSKNIDCIQHRQFCSCSRHAQIIEMSHRRSDRLVLQSQENANKDGMILSKHDYQPSWLPSKDPIGLWVLSADPGRPTNIAVCLISKLTRPETLRR